MKPFFTWIVAQGIFGRLLFGMLTLIKGDLAVYFLFCSAFVVAVEMVASGLVIYPLIQAAARSIECNRSR